MTEAQLLQAILEAYGAQPDLRIQRIQIGAAHDPSTGQVVRFGQPGWADLLVRCGPIAGDLEIKAPTGRQSAPQRAWEATLHAIGARYYLVRSLSDADAAVAELRALAARLHP